MAKVLTIGTRGSNLALWQTRHIEKLFRNLHPDIELHIKIIKTKGDKILDQALSKIDGKGLFTKEIEDNLIAGEIDLAVHSLKDLPTDLPEGLTYGAITSREDSSESFFSKSGCEIQNLPKKAKIFTSSLRRKCQLLHARPDLQISDVRGNIETRIKKYLQNDEIDGMILASAGLARLGLDNLVSHKLDPKVFLPACGQGALAIEIRANDPETAKLLKPLEDQESKLTTDAERSFLASMGGGCQVPMGAYSWVENTKLHIKAFSGDVNGKNIAYAEICGKLENAVEIGIEAAETIKKQK